MVAAVGTVGALWFVVLQQRAFGRDQRNRDEEKRRAQAVEVNIWSFNTSMSPIPEGLGGLPFSRMGSCVGNASRTPIYDVTVVFSTPAGVQIIDDYAPVLGPRSHAFRQLPASAAPDGQPGGGALTDVHALVTFIDSAGERWWRDEYGTLHDGSYVHPVEGKLVPWSARVAPPSGPDGGGS